MYTECESLKDTVYKAFTNNNKIVQICNEGNNVRYSFGKLNKKQELTLIIPKNKIIYETWNGMGSSIYESLCLPNGNYQYCFSSSVDKMSENKDIEQSFEVYNNKIFLTNIELNKEKECISNPLDSIETLLKLPSCPTKKTSKSNENILEANKINHK